MINHAKPSETLLKPYLSHIVNNVKSYKTIVKPYKTHVARLFSEILDDELPIFRWLIDRYLREADREAETEVIPESWEEAGHWPSGTFVS